MAKKTLKTRQVAKMFGVKVETVQRWILERKISATRLDNGRWDIPVSEVARFLKIQKVSR
jgi:excisionase family DNA binding protein